MIDEEKEAIEILKSFEPDDLFECAIYLQALEKITNLIEKHSKEIEENKKYLVNLTHEQYIKLVEQIRNEINKEWKDVIKAKLEELEKYRDKFYERNMLQDVIIKQNQIQVLQLLLENLKKQLED